MRGGDSSFLAPPSSQMMLEAEINSCFRRVNSCQPAVCLSPIHSSHLSSDMSTRSAGHLSFPYSLYQKRSAHASKTNVLSALAFCLFFSPDVCVHIPPSRSARLCCFLSSWSFAGNPAGPACRSPKLCTCRYANTIVGHVQTSGTASFAELTSFIVEMSCFSPSISSFSKVLRKAAIMGQTLESNISVARGHMCCCPALLLVRVSSRHGFVPHGAVPDFPGGCWGHIPVMPLCCSRRRCLMASCPSLSVLSWAHHLTCGVLTPILWARKSKCRGFEGLAKGLRATQ